MGPLEAATTTCSFTRIGPSDTTNGKEYWKRPLSMKRRTPRSMLGTRRAQVATAQEADCHFISTYAEDYSIREDIAESYSPHLRFAIV